MAGKADIIVSINCATKNAIVKWSEASVERERSVGSLDRNTLIKVAGLLGHKFVGKSPLSYTQYELKMLCNNLMGDRTDIVLGAGSRPAVPSPVVTQPSPKPIIGNTQPVRVTPSGVEDALRNVITEAMSAYTESGVDKEVVNGIVAEAIGNHAIAVKAQIDHLTRVVRESKPEVVQIDLTGGVTRKVEGRTHFMFPKVLKVVNAGLSPWITGTAGVGKTMMAEQIAHALGLEYSPESFCSQSSKSEIKGYKDGHGLYQSVEFRQRFEHGGVYLLDEIDAANPNILLTLNSALSNGWMMFPDGKVKRHEKFVAIASANTYGNGATAEYVGRQVIDGSTLNRFVKMDMQIDEVMEAGIVGDLSVDADAGRSWLEIVRRARINVSAHGLKVIVSPRDSYHGARLLNTGFTFQECVPMTFASGLKPEQFAKVMEGVTVPSGGATL
jgi:hypothetical protein